MTRCLFCGRFVKEPRELDKLYPCSCGAYYITCLADDEADTIADLHEELLGEDFILAPPGTTLLELRREGFFDILTEDASQPEEEGVRVVLVFARQAQEESKNGGEGSANSCSPKGSSF